MKIFNVHISSFLNHFISTALEIVMFSWDIVKVTWHETAFFQFIYLT